MYAVVGASEGAWSDSCQSLHSANLRLSSAVRTVSNLLSSAPLALQQPSPGSLAAIALMQPPGSTIGSAQSSVYGVLPIHEW